MCQGMIMCLGLIFYYEIYVSWQEGEYTQGTTWRKEKKLLVLNNVEGRVITKHRSISTEVAQLGPSHIYI